MKQTLQRKLAICSSASLLLLGGSLPSQACGLGEVTITNLPPFASSAYQPYALNSQGQVSGSLFISGVHAPQAFLYSDAGLAQLGTFGGATSFGFAINSSGQVVGKADLAGGAQTHAFLYNGSMLDLGTLGGSSSSASAINDVGLVVGQSTLSGGAGPVAFMYANGPMTSLGTLGGTYSSAFAVNNAGLIVGESTIAGGDTHGFSWANGAIHDLGTLGGNYSSAFAVSPDGVIVGESYVASGDTHAFASFNGTMADLGTLGGTYSSAFGVNSNNQVIGNGTLLNDQTNRGFFYDNGTLTDIGTLGGTNSEIWALNNLGQVVGDAETADGSVHAFLWATNHMTDLNTLLPDNSGWVLVSAIFINDAGRIVGYGTHNGVQSQWFVMDLAKGGNSSPVANAGPNQVVDCQAQVTLDGSGSSDPDNDSLTYSWALGGNLLGMGATLAVSLPLGTNVVTLTVADACGASSSTNVVVTVVDTTPPTGSCPNAVTASSDANCQAAVPNLIPQVVASDNCTPKDSLVITQDPAAGTMVNTGPHSILLTVTDSSGNHSSCTVPFTVVDTTAPTILAAPVSISASVGANCQASVPNVLPNIVATDNCTPANQLVLTQTPAAGTPLSVGQFIVTVNVTDLAGNTTTTNFPLTVINTNPPVIQSVTASPNVLNPPNHQFVPVTISALISGGCSTSVTTKIISITSNEAIAAGDIQITGDMTALLAATRNPSGGGRVYTITVQSVDNSGNSSLGTVTVSVPQGNGSGSTFTAAVRKK